MEQRDPLSARKGDKYDPFNLRLDSLAVKSSSSDDAANVLGTQEGEENVDEMEMAHKRPFEEMKEVSINQSRGVSKRKKTQSSFRSSLSPRGVVLGHRNEG